MDWASATVGALVSIGFGISLWVFLLRRAVLTGAIRTEVLELGAVYPRTDESVGVVVVGEGLGLGAPHATQ
jgi:hypothetical protein